MPPLLHILPHANKWPPLYPLSYTLSGHLQHAPATTASTPTTSKQL